MPLVWEVIKGQGSGGKGCRESIYAVKPWIDRDVARIDADYVGTVCAVKYGIRDARTDQVDTLNVLYRRGQVEDVAVS